MVNTEWEESGGLHRGGILANSEGGRGSPVVEVEGPV